MGGLGEGVTVRKHLPIIVKLRCKGVWCHWHTSMSDAGVRLGGVEGPEAVRELGLPALEMEPRSTALEVSAGEAGVATARKSEVNPDSLPFVLSETLLVVPAKLVRKILSGEFVDMAELLKDNMEAKRRWHSSVTETMQGHMGQPSVRREVPDLLSRLQCFSLYAKVVCSKHPEKTRELWVYQALMISEFRRCGGRGWRLYDTAFRQHAASLEATDFSKINQGLYTTTFLAYGGKGQFCQSCMLSDHTLEECAFHPSRSVPVICIGEWSSKGNKEEARMPRVQECRRPPRGACFAWNDGRCSTPYCRFSHFCLRCGSSNHRNPQCHTQLEPDRRGKE